MHKLFGPSKRNSKLFDPMVSDGSRYHAKNIEIVSIKMLVVKPRGSRHYGGSDTFDAISRNMLSSGFIKATRTGARSAIAQKVADAVVNGATSATQNAVEGAVNETINKVKVLGKRRSSQEEEASHAKKTKININRFIDGSGIVLD